MRRSLSILAVAGLLLSSATAFAQTTPITRFQRFIGNYNFVATGAALRTSPNTTNACAVRTTPVSANLPTVPAGASVFRAYLYWSGSGATIDTSVTLNGAAVNASRTFTSTWNGNAFFGAFADVTASVGGFGAASFGGLTVNTSAIYCNNQTVMGGWALIVIYGRPGEPLRAINVYDGLDWFQFSTLSLTPDGFRVPSSGANGKITIVTWDGDPTNSAPSGGFAESLQINGNTLDDGIVPAGSDPTLQQFDGTINSIGVATSYGVDVDTYDITPYLVAGASSATTRYQTSQDLVFLGAQIVSITSTPQVDLGIAKTHSGIFTVGQIGSYTIKVTNGTGTGMEPEDNPVTVTDTLPAGMSFASASGAGWSCGAASQVVTCTHGPSIAIGGALPDLVLNVNVAGAAVGTVVNQASVTSASNDLTLSNNSATDSTVVVGSDLSTSTKSVVDVNGGSANPGDTLRYTITLNETAGYAATNVSVTDDMPAGSSGFTVVGFPAGAVNGSSGAGTGTNGTGKLNISTINLAANGTASIAFDVQIDAATAPGSSITNTANIVNPSGLAANPSAPNILVSSVPSNGSGNKPLYLRNGASFFLSRTRAAASETARVITGLTGAAAWALTPTLQQNINIPAGNIPVHLYLTRSGNGNRTLKVDLTNSVSGLVGTQTQTVSLPTGATPALVLFSIPNPIAQTFLTGSAFTLSITQTAPASASSSSVYSHNAASTDWPYVDLKSNTVIKVQSVQLYSAPYPSNTQSASYAIGNTAYIRAVIADPFGSYDIASARLNLVDANAAVQLSGQTMTQVADSGAAIRTYEYAYTIPPASPFGTWATTVVGAEGAEGLVTDQASGSFVVAATPATLTVTKSSYVISDPVNGGNNPKRIPGSVQEYSVTVTNQGPGSVDANSVAITDVLPASTEMWVASTPTPPVVFTDGATPSGLAFAIAADLRFSQTQGGGVPFNYTPQPNADGYDPAVTGIRLTPSGVMNGAAPPGSPGFTVRFRVRIK
jgi:trimeric autotransporter adhesin